MDRVEGLVPVMPTPFRDGLVDAEGIESLVAWVAPHVRGITVLGSSGESGYLTPADRRRALGAFARSGRPAQPRHGGGGDRRRDGRQVSLVRS